MSIRLRGEEKISGGERVGTRVGEKSGKRESVDICAICIGRIVNYYHTGGLLLPGASDRLCVMG